MRAQNSLVAFMILWLAFGVEAANYSSSVEAKSALQQAEQQSAAAKAARQSLGNQIEALMREISRLSGQGRSKNTALDQRIWELSRQLAAVVANRDAKLLELREGFWCSQCTCSKSEIEAGCPKSKQTTQDFWEHLANACTPRPAAECLQKATPEQLQAASNEFVAPIEQVQSQTQQLKDEKRQNEAELQAQIAEKQRELEGLRRRATDLNAQISRANAEKMQARNQVMLMGQKEALEAAQKRIAERQELEAKAATARYEAQQAWQQFNASQAQPSAVELTNRTQANEPDSGAAQQSGYSQDQRKLEQTAEQARNQATQATERAVELEKRARETTSSAPATLRCNQSLIRLWQLRRPRDHVSIPLARWANLARPGRCWQLRL